MRILLSISLVFVSLIFQAQDIMLHGRLIEAETGRALKDAYVSVVGTSMGTTTDAEGAFILIISDPEIQGLKLLVQHLGYETKTFSYSPSELKSTFVDGHMELALELTSFSYPLDTAVISANPLPIIVYASEQHSIADYEFMEEGLLLLAYEKRLEKASKIYLLDESMKVKDSLSIPTSLKATGLRRDYAQEVYLELEKGLYWIHVDEKNILRMDEVDQNIFRESVAPIIDTLAQSVYFSTWIERFPAFDYMSYERKDSVYARIRQVADKFMLELCRAEYKYLNTRDKLRLYRLELETGVEKEVLACISTFEQGLYYDPIYAPMFLWKDSLFLLDHYSSQLLIYDAKNHPLDSVPVTYHAPEKVMNNHFAQQIIMDRSNGKLYALFQKPGGKCWLEELDKRTGKTKPMSTLRYAYPTEIQVKEGEVFYLYRPFSSSQKKYLYKEVIRE